MGFGCFFLRIKMTPYYSVQGSGNRKEVHCMAFDASSET